MGLFGPTAPRALVTVPDGVPRVGSYLTDGAILYRVERTHRLAGEVFVGLEDCRTLDIVIWPARAIAQRGLRPVRRSPASVDA
jgi:hypothetical protein